jgi:RecB family exonuclease
VTAAASRAEPAVVIGRGALATEALLLAEIEALVAAARAEPRLLARPVRVIVSSRSLREHVAAKIVARLGSVAGVLVQTLHGVALEILEAAGERLARGDDLAPILARRAAQREPSLHAVLDGLEDGYGAVVGDVSDLLDAGFDPEVVAHGEALEQALAEARLPNAVRERASALARVASATAAGLAALGCERRGGRLARAARLLESDPERLPARALIVHGFADATGVASDLLAALARMPGARMLLDHPPDPAKPEQLDLGKSFTGRLRARLGEGPLSPVSEPPAALAWLRAAGADAEVRAVGGRIRDLLDRERARPESIAVVARSLDAFAIPLRVHFARLGIPFSGRGSAGPPVGAARRVHALVELLSARDAAPLDRWLAVFDGVEPERRLDLRLGLHALGVARLRDVAALDPTSHLDERDALPLPARVGLAAPREEGDEGAGPYVRRRRLPGATLRAAISSARTIAARLAGWPESAPLPDHAERLRALVREDLGWTATQSDAALGPIAGAVAELPALPLARDEWVLLLRRLLRDAGAVDLGGDGAGVQVLSVTEARGRTFEHLFLVGLNREVFPRPIVEDALLPDAVRRPLAASVLAELSIKGRGFEEEHYLFAQLLSASRRVTLSWQVADDDGRARSPSPFVERLLAGEDDSKIEEAPSLSAPPERWGGRPRTAAEAAIVEGVHGHRARFDALLPAVLAERAALDVAPGPAVDVARLARGRAAVLDELGGGRERADSGPYFGFIGPVRLPADPRRADLFVTHVERIARCPWQHVLVRLLGLEPSPDAGDALPELSGLLVGSVAHAALDGIVADVTGEGPRALRERDPARAAAIPWPAPAELDARLLAAAEAVLRQEGLGPREIARVLAERARPLVEAARGLDWPAPDTDLRCLGAELEGEVEAAGRRLRFRADRVDRVAGALRLVDYKTGKPLSGRDRHAKLLEHVATGASLQAPAYAFGSGGEGRFLFLARGAEESAVVGVDATDAALRSAFEATVAIAGAALEAGGLFPRLAQVGEPSPPDACDWCEVRDACLQGDPDARARLHAWASAGRGGTPAERAALALWRLPETET